MSCRPNFLIFCVDQMQSYCLGCNGHPLVKTPNIDALAARGVNFRRGYCNNSVCMPSRATMLTGLTPRQHGLLTNGNSLAADVPTVTQALVDAGYRTHAAGKFHLQQTGGFGGENQQSCEWVQAWNRGERTSLPSPYYGYETTDYVGGHVTGAYGQYRSWLEANHPESSAQLRHGKSYYCCGTGFRIDIPEEHHYNHWIADRSIDFLGKMAGASSSGIKDVSDSGGTGAGCSGHSPFFLFCSFPDPHFPFGACRPYSEMYDPAAIELAPTLRDRQDATDFLGNCRTLSPHNHAPDDAELRELIAQTYAMISHIDANVGRVLRELERSGQADKTVILFIADHGEYLGGHGLLRKSVWPYEELWRIPFIAAAPGGTPGICRIPVSLLDLVPTVLDYAGLEPLILDTRGPAAVEHLALPGESLRPFLEGELQAPHVPLVIEYDEDFHAGCFCRLRGLIDGDWKLVIYAGQGDGVLFNLADDPQELRNLWNDPQAQARKTELLARLVERLAATDRFDTPRLTGA